MGELTKSYLEPLLGPEFLSKMKEINGLLNYLVNYFGGLASSKSLFSGSGLDLVENTQIWKIEVAWQILR